MVAASDARISRFGAIFNIFRGIGYMQRKRLRLVCLLACLAIAIPALAQFGHPLKGSWSGEWRQNSTTEHRILLEFKWEGKYGVNAEGGTLTGTLNPGPDAAP